MILKDLKRDVETSGIEDTGKMHLAGGMEAHFIKILTEYAYSDPLGSLIREGCSNSVDAMIACDKTDPVIVQLENKNGNYFLHFIDKGIGLNLEEFDTFILGLGMSSKRNSDKFLGGFGAGSKNPLAYCDSFVYIIRKDSVERKIILFKGATLPERTVVYEKETTEVNGVEVIIPIDYSDRYDVITKIKEQCSYFDGVYFDISGMDNTYTIYRNDLFQFNTLGAFREMHISLKNVAYPINWKVLGINRIYTPIALRFDNYDFLQPTFNREDIQYNAESIQAIKDKIKEVSEWFCEQYNNQTEEYESLLKAWDKINDDDKYVKVGDKSFEITELEQYSTIKCKELFIKGISILPPKKYRRMFSELTRDFTASGYIYNSRMKTAKHFNDYILGKKTVVINHNLTGFFREYLKEEGYKYILRDGYPTKENLKWYKAHILDDIPKEKWRDAIKEYQSVKENFVKEVIIDGRKLHLSEDFLEFVKENKTTKKYNYSSKTLNKEKGQVTIGWIKPTYYENGYKVDKTVYSQEQLNFHFSTILFLEEDKEIGKELYSVFKDSKNTRYRFAVIGKNEYKKLPKNKKFMLYAKSSKDVRDIKLFRKAATALLFQKEISRWSEITSDGKKIVEQVLLPLYEKVQKVREYANANHYRMSEEVSEMLYQKAEETKDWDYTLWKEYTEVKNALDELDCLKYFAKPNGVSQEDYVKFINEQLLTRKLSGRFKMDSFSICVNDVVTVPEEQLELEFQEENI